MLGPDRNVWLQLREGAPQEDGPPRTVTDFLTARFEGREEPYTGPHFLAASSQLLGLYGLMAIGLIVGLRQPQRAGAILLAQALVGYFLVMSGPEAYPRFRVPFMPFVVLIAAIGAEAVWRQLVGAKTAPGPASALGPRVITR
jgi:hypothetical protein